MVGGGAAAGCSVVVSRFGGAAITEEFHPGFRNSVAAYTVSLLNPKVIADLKLADHGLRIVERRIANFLPLDDGRTIQTPFSIARNVAMCACWALTLCQSL